jgi:hypothetical protein
MNPAGRDTLIQLARVVTARANAERTARTDAWSIERGATRMSPPTSGRRHKLTLEEARKREAETTASLDQAIAELVAAVKR